MRVVDRLLGSKEFGERWGRHWLDVARYPDSNGSEENFTYYDVWRFRNYVIDAFNKDKPFDQFVREQIAGDLLPSADAGPRLVCSRCVFRPRLAPRATLFRCSAA